MTPRVVRFDDEPASGSDRAAPVARFGEHPPGRVSPADAVPAAEDDHAEAGSAGGCRSVADAGPAGAAGAPGMFDDLGSSAAAPVASVEDPAQAPAGPPVAEVADISGIRDAPAPEARTVALTGLVSGGRGRRRSATPKPGSGATTDRGEASSVDDSSAADDSAADDSAAANEPRQRGRFGDRGARRGGGGFGGRGAPAELDPDADPVAVAKEVCLRLLADRARTRQELAQALRRKGVPDDAAHTVLERFDEVGLIDDAAFAGQWVRSRHNHRGLARRAIAMELRRKGVDDEVASGALEEVDQESEERRARELVDRKLRTVPADTPEQCKKAATRLVGMLARKGYGGGIAYRVVREALAAHGAEIDELGTDPLD